MRTSGLTCQAVRATNASPQARVALRSVLFSMAPSCASTCRVRTVGRRGASSDRRAASRHWHVPKLAASDVWVRMLDALCERQVRQVSRDALKADV
eukprot:5285731-Pleurochrysis_carterae.AAC.2